MPPSWTCALSQCFMNHPKGSQRALGHREEGICIASTRVQVPGTAVLALPLTQKWFQKQLLFLVHPIHFLSWKRFDDCFRDLPDTSVTFLSPLAPERGPSKYIFHKGSYSHQCRSFKWLRMLRDTAIVCVMPSQGMTSHPQVPGTGTWFYSVVKVLSEDVF